MIPGTRPARFARKGIRPAQSGGSGPARDGDTHAAAHSPASGRRKLFQQVRRTALWPAPRIAYDLASRLIGRPKKGQSPSAEAGAQDRAGETETIGVAILLRTPARHRQVRFGSCFRPASMNAAALREFAGHRMLMVRIGTFTPDDKPLNCSFVRTRRRWRCPRLVGGISRPPARPNGLVQRP